MYIFSIFKIFSLSYWRRNPEITTLQKLEVPKDMDQKLATCSRENLLLYLATHGANDDHLSAVQEVFNACDRHSLPEIIPYLIGSYSLIFRTSNPTPEHLKSFATFIIASINGGMSLNKKQVYELTAIFVMKMREGIDPADIPKAMLDDLCGKGEE